MNELVKLVEEWAKEKRLDKAEPEKQMLKVGILLVYYRLPQSSLKSVTTS